MSNDRKQSAGLDPASRSRARNGLDFAVADLDLAESGRNDIRLAEHDS
jgi:hypothetical protein